MTDRGTLVESIARVRFLKPLAFSLARYDANYGQLIQDANALADEIEQLQKIADAAVDLVVERPFGQLDQRAFYRLREALNG